MCEKKYLFFKFLCRVRKKIKKKNCPYYYNINDWLCLHNICRCSISDIDD